MGLEKISIREEIEAARWPEIFVTDVIYKSNFLSFTFLKLRKSKKSFSYNYYSFKTTGITYIDVTILNRPRGDSGCVEIYDFSTGYCSYAPGFAGMSAGIMGNPFVETDRNGETNRLEILFESDSLEVVNLKKSEIFSVGTDFEKLPEVVRCSDTLNEFKINLRYRREQAEKKNKKRDISKMINVLLDEGLIENKKIREEKLNYKELRQYLLESNFLKSIELPVENIGCEVDADEHYVDLLKYLEMNSNDAMELSNIESMFENDVVEIRFLLNMKEHNWSFEQSSDSLAEEFVDLFCSLQDELSSGGYLYFENSDYPSFLFVPRIVYVHFKHQS
jgi:hypothetical protein